MPVENVARKVRQTDGSAETPAELKDVKRAPDEGNGPLHRQWLAVPIPGKAGLSIGPISDITSDSGRIQASTGNGVQGSTGGFALAKSVARKDGK